MTTENIYSHSHGFEMFRLDAGTVAAEMVEGQSFGNWAYQEFIREAVGLHLCIAVNMKIAISSTAKTADPLPAIIKPSLMDFRPEPFGSGQSEEGSKIHQGIAMMLPSLVMSATPRTSEDRGLTVRDATMRLHRKVSPSGDMQRGAYHAAAASIIPQAQAPPLSNSPAAGENHTSGAIAKVHESAIVQER